MRTQRTGDLRGPVERLRKRFERWRKTRKPAAREFPIHSGQRRWRSPARTDWRHGPSHFAGVLCAQEATGATVRRGGKTSNQRRAHVCGIASMPFMRFPELGNLRKTPPGHRRITFFWSMNMSPSILVRRFRAMLRPYSP